MPKRGQLTPSQKAAVAGAGGGGLALAATLAILPVWEGKSNTPYFDSVGVATVCYGETAAEMREYSDAECTAMLTERAKEFQTAVLRINPRLSTDPYQWAAHTSLAYNIGVSAYAKSSIARLYKEGDEIAACDAIGKYKYAGGRVLRGLVLRRQGDANRLGEVELCKTPHPSLGRVCEHNM